jgi:uncharacterized membrane protein
MSFFSGFSENLERRYRTSFSEAMATQSNISFSLFSILITFQTKKKIIFTIINIIFFILFITILVIYYIKKNEIIKVFELNADYNLNKLYFTVSIVVAVFYIIIISLI